MSRAPVRSHADPGRVEELFAVACGLPVAARVDFLARECAGDCSLHTEVASLLAAHDDADGEIELDAGRAAELLDAALTPGGDRMIGPYRVVRILGQGGMGTVFLAERVEGGFEQRVALKLIKKGMDSEAILARFHQERQILARLEHPGIARLLDGGVSEDGQPFFAMEHVDGEPITDYAAGRGLDVGERLTLFLQVCDAVQQAHRSLIVHRDLKPSNILVTEEGRVKLVDFGIAKVLDPDDPTGATTLTRLGMRPLTPAYASPEQVRGELLTTASDVYGLGVVLYELLSGRLPHAGPLETPEQVARAVCETEPVAPSITVREDREDGERIARRLRGDLDAVVGKALAKDRDRRYPSVEALAEDLRRHLAGEPVQARPPGAFYRAGKFVRRHRVGVVLGAAVLLALMLGLAGTAWQAAVASAERDRARQAAEEARRERDRARQLGAEAREVADFLVDLFRSPELGRTPIEDMTARQLVDAGAVRLEGELADQPLTRARLMETIGDVYLSLQILDRAEEQFEGALALREKVQGPDDPGLLPALQGLAATHWRQIRYADSEAVVERAMQLARGEEVTEPLAVGRSLFLMGNLRLVRNDPVAAEELYRRAWEPLEKELGADHREVASLLNNLGAALEYQGELEAAAVVHRQALETRRRALGPDHADVAQSLQNLGRIELGQGEAGAARTLFERALEIRTASLGEEHTAVAESLDFLGRAEAALGFQESAEERLRRALAIREARLGSGHPETARLRLDLASLLHDQERFDEALEHAESAFSAIAAAPEAAPVDRVRSRALRIELLWRLGRLEAAREALATNEPPGVEELVEALERHGFTEEAAHLAAVSL